jgi:hypothetical protein
MRRMLFPIKTSGFVALLLVSCQTVSTLTTPPPTENAPLRGLSADQVAALQSLKRIDDYPLYTMTLAGDAYHSDQIPAMLSQPVYASAVPGWGCSLFASFTDPEALLYGRNFDWEYSPGLLLFAHPTDGYASVSMVDMIYLGLSKQQIAALDEAPLEKRIPLLGAADLPFDGMNDQGLVIGMAAVPPGNVPTDHDKPTIGTLGVIREMLDHAANVEEAVAILQSYNVDFSGGPPVHYLIADAGQNSALVEFYAGEVVVLSSETGWQAATNFLVSDTHGEPAGHCDRYDRITDRLSGGETLSAQDALELLKSVAQSSTQWSVVYDYGHGTVEAVMGRQYGRVHRFQLGEQSDP